MVVPTFTRLALIINYCQDMELPWLNYHCSQLFYLWMQWQV